MAANKKKHENKEIGEAAEAIRPTQGSSCMKHTRQGIRQGMKKKQ